MKVFSFYNLDKPSSRKLRKLNWKLSKINLTIESQKMQRTFGVKPHFLQRTSVVCAHFLHRTLQTCVFEM